MAFPSKNAQVVANGLKLLTGAYRNKPNVVALLTALLNRVQDIEDVAWDIIDSMLLTSPPTGDALDQIGSLVDFPRAGFSDAQYLVFIKMAIRARRSGGRAEDIIQVVALVLAGATYEDFPPAAFFVSTLDITESWAIPIGQGIEIARDLGVRGVYVWSSWATSSLFYFGDSGGSVAGSGFQDSVSGAFPEGLASAIEV